MRKSGSTLAETLHAGQWKSAAFLSYIDEMGLEWVGMLCCARCRLALLFALQDLAFAAAVESDEEVFID